MKYVYLALNWMLGVLAFLTGLALMSQSILGGMSLILISLLLLPPVRNFVFTKTNKELSFKIRGIAIFVLIFAFAGFVGQSQDRKRQDLAAKEIQDQAQKVADLRQQNIDYFNQNSSLIISDIEMSIQNSDYKKAVSLSSKYLPSKNKDIIELNTKAKSELAASVRISNTNKILAELKTIPASKYKENMDLYQQLVTNNPGNEKYKSKLNYYSKLIKEQKEKGRIAQEKLTKEREARIAKFGEPPAQSAWDGSYYQVEMYLERIANDPDSIKIDGCSKLRYTESGWLVGCDYRGRNAFGGMIRQSNWFTIVHGRVIKMHDSSAYKL